MDWKITAKIKEKVLNNECLKITKHIPKDFEKDLYFYEDYVSDCLVMEIQRFYACERTDVQTISYPDNWWEAFKERWFPKKWLDRNPVKYKTHHISFDILYPDFEPTPGSKTVIKYIEH